MSLSLTLSRLRELRLGARPMSVSLNSRPLMTTCLLPTLTRGNALRERAAGSRGSCGRLTSGSERISADIIPTSPQPQQVPDLGEGEWVENRNLLITRSLRVRKDLDSLRLGTQRVSEGNKGSLLQDIKAVSFPRAGQGRRKLQKASGSAWENRASDHRRLGS